MVKIQEKTGKTLDDYVKEIKSFENEIKSEIPESKIVLNPGYAGFGISVENNLLSIVDLGKRSILLINKNYFDKFYRIARKYEDLTKKEWTLKKEYSE